MWLVLRECKVSLGAKKHLCCKIRFHRNREVKGSLKKSSIYVFLSIHTCNPNVQYLLEIKNMKYALIPQTLELDFIAPILSFVPSQRRNQMKKHQRILSLWVWLSPVHVCPSLWLLKKIYGGHWNISALKKEGVCWSS